MAVYDKFAEYYDRAFAPLERIGLERYREEAMSLLPQNAAILELGAGTGANFSLYPQSRLAVATELSVKMLEIAAEKNSPALLVNADAEQLPFADQVFDAAFATLVFCSIPEPGNAFLELRRVIKPGGKVVLLEHVRPDGRLLGPAFDLLSRGTVALFEDHFNRRTSRLAEDAGLKILDVRRKLRGIVNLIVCEV